MIGKHFPEHREVVRRGIGPALASGEERLVLAALRSLTNHPDLRPDGLDLRLLMFAAWPSVRVGALSALLADDSESAREASLALTGDSSPYVRRQLVHLAAHLGNGGDALLRELVNDQDCFVRALARQAIEEEAPASAS